MGVEKKFQMLRSDFETAIADDDADGVLSLSPQILEELDAYRKIAHKYAHEARHLELTREERAAIERLCYFTEQPDQKDAVIAGHDAATLRGLLARTAPPVRPRSPLAQIGATQPGDAQPNDLWD